MIYVAGLMGYSHLDFDIQRNVTETGAFATPAVGEHAFGDANVGL
jgi:hypothetical protein